MAKRLMSRINFNFNKFNLPKLAVIGSSRKLHTNEVPVKEIKIPVKWGQMTAKLWGNEQDRPILALHGWQDNAGTWDPLAPMLVRSSNRPILALDFPGHGFSDWIPPGMQYYSWEFPRIILYLKDYFKWDKVSLLAHSMGSIASFRFASLFSDDVEFYIAIDSLIHDDYDLNQVVENFPTILRKIQIAQSRLNQEPPSYTWEEMIKIWHTGTRKSVSIESVPYLLKRGSKQSTQDSNQYYFSRDARLKHTFFNPENKKFVETLALRLKCPTLYVKAIDSPYAADEYAVDMRDVVERNNENFECQFTPGTHHVHLNNPELILPLIMNFLTKHNLL